MNKKVLFNELLLCLVPIIWGAAFIYQDLGNNYFGPIIFSGLRCLLGSSFLMIIIFIRYALLKIQKKDVVLFRKSEFFHGMILGVVTAMAMSVQQIGIKYEGAGKSGFITSLYIIFVPIIGILFHKKTNFIVAIALMIAISGLYFINANDGNFCFDIGFVLLLLSAVLYAIQILLIDLFSPGSDAINLSALQFLFATIIQIPISFIFEESKIIDFNKGLPSLIFCGIFSTGIAFTIQTYAQKNVPVVLASVIMSLESVFALLFSYIYLHSTYTYLEIIGCALIFISVIIIQIPIKRKKKQTDWYDISKVDK